jgi:hypothetical protein
MDTNGVRRAVSRALLLAFTALSVAAASGCSSGAPASRVSAAPPSSVTSTRLPLAFEANQGQTDARVRFLARGPRYTVFLTDEEAVLALRGSAEAAVVRLRPVGASSATPVGLDTQATRVNVLRGHDPSAWHSGIPTYGRVLYPHAYPGIDLVFYSRDGGLEYDVAVAPGADPRMVRLAVEGADRLRLDAGGDLILETAGGPLRMRAPVAYQDTPRGRQTVAARYALSDGVLGFDVGAYDHSRPLVIDPVLTYSTYLGGNGDDASYAITLDASGAAYITGRTQSTDFPTRNAVQSGLGQPPAQFAYDAFVAKIAPDGGSLIYATYLGGNGADEGHAIALDAAGNAWVGGVTASTDFPTANPLVASNPSGMNSPVGFVARLSADGSQLLFSSYLNSLYVRDLALDAAGNVYVVADAGDAAVSVALMKLAPDGSRLMFSNTFGDRSNPAGIALDTAGNIYVAGRTTSTAFPTTANALKRTHTGSDTEGFVTKLGPDGVTILYSTYLGGSGYDRASSIVVDSSGAIYVSGNTTSTDFPTVNPVSCTCTFDSYQGNIFLSKIAPDGSRFVFSTYLGPGDGRIALGPGGYIYIGGGRADSVYRGIFVDPLQDYRPGDNGLVYKIDPSGQTIVYSTPFGGSANDQVTDIAVDAEGQAYVTGWTSSSDFPTMNALQPSLGQPQSCCVYDAFVAKIGSVRAAITQPTAGATVSGTVWITLWIDGGAGALNRFTLTTASGQAITDQTTSDRMVTVPWNTAAGADGPQTILATVRDALGQTGRTQLAVTVGNGTASTLTASITSPAESATVSGTVNIGMAESGASGTPITFTLAVDSTQVFSSSGTATTAAFTWNSANVAAGTHTLNLTVRDGGGRTATTARTVTVNSTAPPPPPSGTIKVYITQPVNGSTATGTVWFTIWIENAAAGSKTFSLSVAGAPGGSTTSTSNGPISMAWNSGTVANGAQTATVTVTDSAGNTGSGSITLNVQNSGGGAPPPLVASFTSPADGATVTGTVTVGMAETGANGTPISFTLSVDSTQVYTTSGTATTAAYAWNSASVANGTHTLNLSVGDGAGRTATASRTVSVTNTQPPPPGTIKVYITQPSADGATVSGTAWFTIWIENAAAGSKTYTLSVDGTTMATTTTTSNGPVSIPWSTASTSNGSHPVTLAVRDSAGATGSATRMVNVAN